MLSTASSSRSPPGGAVAGAKVGAEAGVGLAPVVRERLTDDVGAVELRHLPLRLPIHPEARGPFSHFGAARSFHVVCP